MAKVKYSRTHIIEDSASGNFLNHPVYCIVSSFPERAKNAMRPNKSLEDYFSLDCHYQLITRAIPGSWCYPSSRGRKLKKDCSYSKEKVFIKLVSYLN